MFYFEDVQWTVVAFVAFHEVGADAHRCPGESKEAVLRVLRVLRLAMKRNTGLDLPVHLS